MKQESFEAQRSDDWNRYAAALATLQRGYRLSSDADPEDFVVAYKRLARDLSIARARGYSQRLVRRLNDLVVQGHNVVYAYRGGFARATLIFLRAGFPAQVRRAWPYVLASCALFLVPLVAMTVTVTLAPEWVYSVMSGAQASQLEAMYDPSAAHFGRERQSEGDFAMFGFYIMNNISITFRLFASGMTFGLGTIFYVVFNAVYLGAATGHLVNVGYQSTFFSFVVGHGAFELTALVVAGAAGLMMGHALLDPGPQKRLSALRRVAPNAVQIAMGAALMCLVAAFVEAFWSASSRVPGLVKFGVGALLWIGVLGYFAFAGRGYDDGE